MFRSPQFIHHLVPLDDYEYCAACQVIVVRVGCRKLYIDTTGGIIEGTKRYKCVPEHRRKINRAVALDNPREDLIL